MSNSYSFTSQMRVPEPISRLNWDRPTMEWPQSEVQPVGYMQDTGMAQGVHHLQHRIQHCRQHRVSVWEATRSLTPGFSVPHAALGPAHVPRAACILRLLYAARRHGPAARGMELALDTHSMWHPDDQPCTLALGPAGRSKEHVPCGVDPTLHKGSKVQAACGAMDQFPVLSSVHIVQGLDPMPHAAHRARIGAWCWFSDLRDRSNDSMGRI